jgi:hypothetical protein
LPLIGTKDLRVFETELETKVEIEIKDEIEIPRKLGMTLLGMTF